MKIKSTHRLPQGSYMPLGAYALSIGVKYHTLYTRIRAGHPNFPHYQVGRAHLVRVGK